MDAHQTAVAKLCLDGAHDGKMDFPAIVGTLIAAGFEGYTVDFRRQVATYYAPDGSSLELPLPADGEGVAAGFDGDAVKEAIRQAQSGDVGYSYTGFCRTVKVAGCAGYMVSFLGQRVVYFGRTAEMHVEHFPN